MTTKVKKTKAKSKTTVETKDEDYMFPPTKDKTPTLPTTKSKTVEGLWKPLDGSTSVLPVPGGVVIARGGTMVFTPKVRLKKNVQGDWTLVS